MSAATARETTSEIVLGPTNYGKSEVRIFKVKRDTPQHEVWDLNVRVVLEGDFDVAYEGDDNTQLLATDTMRNTVYALAKDHLSTSAEAFALALVDHFLKVGPTVERVQIHVTQYPWDRIQVDGQGHQHSFVRGAGERKALVTGDKSGTRHIEAGLDNVLILKTTNSGWEKFYQEQYTTLPDTNDRILATSATAKWVYNTTDADFDQLWTKVRDQMLATFTDHYSPSMQNTLYRMGKAILESTPPIDKIWFSFPNKHHLLYNLGRFGMDNKNEIFEVSYAPYGQIEGWVERRGQQ